MAGMLNLGKGKGMLRYYLDSLAAIQRAEGERRANEQKFRAQYNNMPIPTYTWRKIGDDFLLEDYNYAADEATQGQISQLVGKTLSELYADMPEVQENFWRCYNISLAGTFMLIYPWPCFETLLAKSRAWWVTRWISPNESERRWN
jgi:hypothetical protein